MFLLVPLAFQGRGISFEQPAAPAGIGPGWLLQLLTTLRGARGARASVYVRLYVGPIIGPLPNINPLGVEWV